MAKVSSTEANRSFSKILAEVRKGKIAEITVRGEVVAEMRPVTKRSKAEEIERQKSWDEFIERLRTQKPIGVPRGTREELYDEN